MVCHPVTFHRANAWGTGGFLIQHTDQSVPWGRCQPLEDSGNLGKQGPVRQMQTPWSPSAN